METIIHRGLRALGRGFGCKKNGAAAEPRPAGLRSRSRALARYLRREEGNALVEFTLTLPILLAVLVAIFQFGIAFNNQLTLTQGVGAAAQYLQTIRASTTDPCKDTLTAIENSAPHLVPVGTPRTGISLTLTMNGTQVPGSSCAGDQTDLVQGGPVTVYATYPCNITLFGINLGGLYKRNFSCNLTAQVTEYEY